MSKRLHVLLSDQEMADIQQLADRERVTVGPWVRRTLRDARASKSASDPDMKLKAIRRGAELSFPTAGIEQILVEIERGYHG
jgi:hypothetical protein